MKFKDNLKNIICKEVIVYKNISFNCTHYDLNNVFCVLDDENKTNILNQLDSQFFLNKNLPFLFKNYPNIIHNYYYLIKDNEYLINNTKKILIQSCLYSNFELTQFILNLNNPEDFKKIINREVLNAAILGGSIDIINFLLKYSDNQLINRDYLSKKWMVHILYNHKFDVYQYFMTKYFNEVSDNEILYRKWLFKYVSIKEKEYKNKIQKSKNHNQISLKNYVNLDKILKNMIDFNKNIHFVLDENLFSKIYYYCGLDWLEQNIQYFTFSKNIYLKVFYSYKNNYKYYENFITILDYLKEKEYFKHLPVFEEWLNLNNPKNYLTKKNKYHYYQDIFKEFIKDTKFITHKSKLGYENLMNKNTLLYLLNHHFEELRILGFLNSILDYIFMSNSLSLIQDLSDFISPRPNFYLFAIDKIGNIESLQYLIDIQTPKQKNICEYAALTGKLNILQFLHQNQFPWDELTTNAACMNNHIDCLEYALQNGCKWNPQSWMYVHKNMERYFKTKNNFIQSLKQIKKDDTENLELAKEFNKKLDDEYQQLLKMIQFIKNYEKENNIESLQFSVISENDNIKKEENEKENNDIQISESS